MACPTAFRAVQGEIEPFDRPFASGTAWKDVLRHENFRAEPCLQLGTDGDGFHLDVHPAINANAPYQEFAFLVVIWLGNIPHPVFCGDLAELLPLLRNLLPLVEFTSRAETESWRERASNGTRSLLPALAGDAAPLVATSEAGLRSEQTETTASTRDTVATRIETL